MTIAPPTIYYCPSCGKPMLKRNFRSYTVRRSTLYSDGLKTGLPHFTPNLAKCPNCRALFFLHNLWAQKEDESIGGSPHIEDIEDLSLSDYIKAVERGLAKTPEEEVELRTRLWRSLNSIVRYGTAAFSPDQMKLWQENCEKLLALQEQEFNNLTQTDDTEIVNTINNNVSIINNDVNTINTFITILELKRNLGRFDECINGLARLPESYDWFKKPFAQKCGAKDTAVFILKGEEEDEPAQEEESPILIEESYDILQNSEGDLLFCINARDGDPIEPEILYSGGENALFRRSPWHPGDPDFREMPGQFILLDHVHPDAREALHKAKEVLIVEFDPRTRNDRRDKDSDEEGDEGTIDENGMKGAVREYMATVRPVFETLETVKTIPRDGYPFFTSLRARVHANKDKPIAEVINERNYSDLAAVLAREEDYEFLDKYFAEGLPINEFVSGLFRTWQPAPFYYISIKPVFALLKDPLKMMRYLVDHGADPDLSCAEGDDTPLGNQCCAVGTPEIMKALLEAGADPNVESKLGIFLYKPLLLLICPDCYDNDTHLFIPYGESVVERARLLIEAGADVNLECEIGTPLSMAITYGAADERVELVQLLIGKGASIEAAVKSMEAHAGNDNPEFYYALYELYAGFAFRGNPIPELAAWKNREKAMAYLTLGAQARYDPAEKLLAEENNRFPSPEQ